MKNIEVLITDLLLKVHAQSIKYFVAIDFLHEVDFQSGKNRTQLLDGRLEVMVMKAVPGKSWASLENKKLTRQELMERRNMSVDRFYLQEKEEKKQASDTIIEMGRTTIREQMNVEKHERKTIKHGKRDQLEAAKADLFADLDQVNEMDQKLTEMGKV